MSENSRRDSQQVRHYSGVFSHPSFGPDELSIEVTLDGSCKGWWKALDQREEITVVRNGKSIVLVDRSSTTTFDGHEVVGGMLVGTVFQRGEPGGRFRLQPCNKSRVRTASLTRTIIKRSVQIPMVSRTWCAVGVPTKLPTSYQMALA